jgi:hypothetical protein
VTARTYDAAVDAVVDLLNSGYLVGYTGTRPAANAALTGSEVFTCTFGATAFGDSTSGTATANSITSDSDATGGTVGYVAVLESDGTTVVMTLTAGTSGEDANFDSLTVSAGVTVSCSSMTVSVV